jgi:hypothetical protein
LNRQRLILALACALLAVLLGAPAPGSVSGCNVESVPADPQMFCQRKEEIECQRREARGEIMGAEVPACIAAAPTLCVAFSFGVNCRPNNNETDACLEDLRRFENLGVMFQNIPTCRALCD